MAAKTGRHNCLRAPVATKGRGDEVIEVRLADAPWCTPT